VYLPYDQAPSRSLALFLRRTDDAALSVATARRVLQAVDPDQAVRGGDAYTALIERSLGGFDITVLLVVVIALAATSLAALGLYSVVAFWVACRRRETAIRVAIGASPARVTREIVKGGLRLAAGGAVAGLLLSLAVGKLLSFRLRGVDAFDPVILAGTCLLVTVVVGMASYMPARSAARADPKLAMAEE
jgi:ABC-type antimicrobial peptide transport system permease subunit